MGTPGLLSSPFLNEIQNDMKDCYFQTKYLKIAFLSVIRKFMKVVLTNQAVFNIMLPWLHEGVHESHTYLPFQ